MRHRKSNIKLGRTASHRKAMLRNLATSLIEFETIKTTVSKAKAVRPLIDRLVTLAKKGDLTAIRKISSVLYSRPLVGKLIKISGERFGGRNSGFTVLAKTGFRAGDCAPTCILSLIKADHVKVYTGGTSGSKTLDRGRRVAASRLTKAVSEIDASTSSKSTSQPQDDLAKEMSELKSKSELDSGSSTEAEFKSESGSSTEAEFKSEPDSGSNSEPESKPEDSENNN
jgi:large subunit ribosomal protein L17